MFRWCEPYSRRMRKSAEAAFCDAFSQLHAWILHTSTKLHHIGTARDAVGKCRCWPVMHLARLVSGHKAKLRGPGYRYSLHHQPLLASADACATCT